MRIFIEDSFDAAHRLPRVPASHKCHNLHGHTYRVHLEFGDEIDPALGWVIDYAEVKAAWEPVKILLDHKILNDKIDNPTCENLALFIQRAIWSQGGRAAKLLRRIEIRETEHAGVVLDCQ